MLENDIFQVIQINIDKDLSEIGMNLDDNVLYNCTDASSQVMRDDSITPWRDHKENIHYSSRFLLMPFQNPKTLLQTSLLLQI